jgi:ATP-dependent DNA ligase
MPRSLDDWRRSEATALPGGIKPQLTKLVDQAPDGPDWLHEIKFDGYRMHARFDYRGVRRSSGGTLIPKTCEKWRNKNCPT